MTHECEETTPVIPPNIAGDPGAAVETKGHEGEGEGKLAPYDGEKIAASVVVIAQRKDHGGKK